MLSLPEPIPRLRRFHDSSSRVQSSGPCTVTICGKSFVAASTDGLNNPMVCRWTTSGRIRATASRTSL